MGAKVPPAGEKIPVKQGNQDVKASSEPSTHEPEVSSNESKVGAKENEAVSFDESDLKQFEEEKKIPYTRFKEVNEKVRSLQDQIAELNLKHQEDVKRVADEAERKAESKLKARESNVFSDPYVSDNQNLLDELQQLRTEVKQVRTESEEQRLDSLFKSLAPVFPEADKLAVLGWAKSTGKKDARAIEEYMELSHTRNLERAEAKLKSLLETKKQKAKAALPTRNVGPRLNESDRPKSLKDAHKAVKRFFTG